MHGKIYCHSSYHRPSRSHRWARTQNHTHQNTTDTVQANMGQLPSQSNKVWVSPCCEDTHSSPGRLALMSPCPSTPEIKLAQTKASFRKTNSKSTANLVLSPIVHFGSPSLLIVSALNTWLGKLHLPLVHLRARCLPSFRRLFWIVLKCWHYVQGHIDMYRNF